MTATPETNRAAAGPEDVNRGSHSAEAESDYEYLKRLHYLLAFMGCDEDVCMMADLRTPEEARAALPAPMHAIYFALVCASRGAPLPEWDDVSRAMAATMDGQLTARQMRLTALIFTWYTHLDYQRRGLLPSTEASRAARP